MSESVLCRGCGLPRDEVIAQAPEGGPRSSVLQEWVATAPWKCQSILLSGLRGPDHPNCPNIKRVTRWMRRMSQNNADPSTDYMHPALLPPKEDVEAELEFLPCHFVHHFADALRVLGIWHPEEAVRNYANVLHEFIAEETFHFRAETTAEFIWRHRVKLPSEVSA